MSSGQPSRPRTRWAISAILPCTALLALAADQSSKLAVQHHFPACNYLGQTIIPDWLSLSYTCNSGAAFGLLANATLLFVLIAVVVIGVIIAYFRFLPANRPWLRLSLGLQLGGALGNLIDRLRQGYVVDFIYFKNMPVFNIADCCIVVGVAILAFHLLFMQSQPAPAADTDQKSGPQPINPQHVSLGEQPPGDG